MIAQARAHSLLRGGLLIGLLFAVLALTAALAPAAQADFTQLGAFGSSQLGGLPAGIAVDQSSGDVYVADPDNNQVDRFDSEGNFLSSFPAPEPFGLAIDPTSGDIYVSEPAEDQIDRYDSSGSLISNFGEAGSGEGQFHEPATLAIDPTSGDLYVADNGNERVQRFDSSGNYLSQIAGLQNPWALAVDSAQNLYVAALTAGVVDKFDSSGNFVSALASGSHFEGLAADAGGDVFLLDASNQQLLEFDSSGVQIASFGSGSAPGLSLGMAFGDTAGRLYVGAPAGNDVLVFGPPPGPTPITDQATELHNTTATLQGTVNPNGAELTECVFEYGPEESYGQTAPCEEPSAEEVPADFEAHQVHADLSGLTPTKTYHFRLKAANVKGTNQGADRTFATTGPPAIDAQSQTGVTRTTATLQAEINPDGLATSYHFEYVDDAHFTASGFSAATSVPILDAEIGSQTTDQQVSQEIAGLLPATTYHYRVVATNECEPGRQCTEEGSAQSFETEPAVRIDASSVTDVTDTSAELHAQIDPQGGATGYHFEYIDDSHFQADEDAFGAGTQSFPKSDAAIGSGASDVSVAEKITGLSPQTTYHYRVVATGPDGTTPGPGGSFTTYATPSAGLPDDRAYEQVTPVDKDGDDTTGDVNLIQASPSGDRLTFSSTSGVPGGSGAQEVPEFLASRGEAGWSTQGLLPPPQYGQVASVIGWSEDLSQAFDVAEVRGQGDLYLRDSATGALRTVATASGSGDNYYFDAVSADGSRVLFEVTGSPLSVGGANGADNLYEWDRGDGQLRLVAAGAFAGPYDWIRNVLNEGGGARGYYTQNTISADGSRVFFTEAGTGQIYMREGAAPPVAVSSPVSSDPAVFLSATPSGSTVFFTVDGDLYRFDSASRHLTALTSSDAGVQGLLGTSEDGSYVYFAANGVLAPGASAGGCSGFSPAVHAACNLYLWHDGSVSFISSLLGGTGNSDTADWYPSTYSQNSELFAKTTRVTPDGRTLLFRSQAQLTSYPNAGALELYRYEAPNAESPTGHLGCVSCNPTGAPPTGSAQLQTIKAPDLSSASAPSILTRNLSADGSRVFFETPDALLPTDTNGINDVYEWEADGAGSCHGMAQDGGCLFLLSTGKSPFPSYFADASASGDDAFFFTRQPLVGQDGDQLQDVYDARVGGGLATQNPPQTPPCEGDGCKPPPSAPPLAQPPGSSSFSGPPSPPPTHKHRQKHRKHHRKHDRNRERLAGHRRGGAR